MWLIWDLKCACHIDRSVHLMGGVHSPARWDGNKWGMTGSWRSSSYGFFNLPDASHWQRLITRWHGAVMVTLSHLFVGRREGGWRCMMCVCGFLGLCVWRLTDSMLPLLPLVKVLLRVGLLSLSMRSPAALLTAVHRPYQSQRAEQRVRVGRC